MFFHPIFLMNIFVLLTVVVVPIILFLILRRSYSSRVKELIELVENRSKIEELLKEEDESSKISALRDRLEKVLEQIDVRLNKQDMFSKISKIKWFILFFMIEILFLFNFSRKMIMMKSYENGFYFMEGVFQHPVVRMLVLLFLIFISFTISYDIFKSLKSKYFEEFINKHEKNNVMRSLALNLILFVIFNFLLFLICVTIGGFLSRMDPFINWF